MKRKSPVADRTAPDAIAPALAHLRRDPRLAAVIARVGAFAPALTPDPFLALVGSIIHQQVSMAAAQTMLRRLRALCPRGRITPAVLLALDAPTLRTAGLSRQKAGYLHDLAGCFARRELTRAGLRRMNDEDAIAAATRVRGIGRWTAEMLLIFSLQRPDVWPVDDLGVRKAVQALLGRAAPLDPTELHAVAEPWRPYRSYATWYLWRSLDNPVAPRIS
jgi:DNA-3-methyladenine glycosylase II